MILSIIENVANEYGGPANSLPNFLYAVERNLELASRIYSVKLSENECNEFIERYGIDWINCNPTGIRKLMYSRELAKAIKRDVKNSDIIFSNNLWNYPAYISARLSKIHDVPHIISVRGTLYPWSLQQGYFRKKLAWYLFQKKALQDASIVHVTCEDELKAVRELGITSPIALIPHGINYEEYQRLPQRRSALDHLQLSTDKQYFLFMSRLHKKKGLDLLLSVWSKIAKRFPEWCLLIAGPDYGNYDQKINSLIEQKSLTNSVRNLGMLSGNAKLSALSCSEFFVLPSYSENFGVVIGEALAAGLPTITTTGTPWSEIINYNCGEYIKPESGSLEASLVRFLKCDTATLSLMSQEGKRLIREKYSWDSQAQKFMNVIHFINGNSYSSEVIKV